MLLAKNIRKKYNCSGLDNLLNNNKESSSEYLRNLSKNFQNMTAVTDDFYFFTERIYKFLKLNFDPNDQNTGNIQQKITECIGITNLRFPGLQCCKEFVVRIYIEMYVDYYCKQTRNSKSSGQKSTLRAQTKQFGKRKASLPPQSSNTRPTRTTRRSLL